MHCYECGGTSDRECSKSKDAGDIVRAEMIVSCNSTAHSCMTADRDNGERALKKRIRKSLQIKTPSVIEQRTCWSAEVKGCTVYTPGQPRVCACLSELCNCQGVGGPDGIDIECPKWRDMKSTASNSRHQYFMKGTPVMVIVLHCAFMLGFFAAPTNESWAS